MKAETEKRADDIIKLFEAWGLTYDQMLEVLKLVKVKLAMIELDKCIEKAKPNLSKIKDVDEYLNEIKGL